jgi:5-oxoprolinase (ATP-hydrolysing)
MLNAPAGRSAEDSPAVAAGNVETSQRIVDVILGAWQIAAASQGTMNNLLFGNEQFGYYETLGGGAGAGPTFAGADAVHTHMTNTRLTDVEVLERRYPVRVRRFEIRRGSGGEGLFTGGCGLIREMEFLAPLHLALLTQRRTQAPFGLSGGGSGKPGCNLLIRGDGRPPENIGPVCQTTVQAGDVLRIETPGGGGWGNTETNRAKV